MSAGSRSAEVERIAALALYLAVLLALLLIPFDFFHEEVSIRRIRGGFVFPDGLGLVALVEWAKSFGHAVVFVPLGILLGARVGPGARPGWRTLGAVAAGAVASEALQLTVGRGASVADAVMDVAGYLAGLWLATRWSRSEGLRSLVARASRPAVAFALVLAVAAGVWLAARPTDRVPFGGPPLESWDLGHPLCLGNELTGRRPWAGTIEEVRIHDRALEPEEVASPPADGDLDASVVAAYRFPPVALLPPPGAPIPAVRGPALTLDRGRAERLAEGGIRFLPPSLLVGRGPAWDGALRAIVRSGELSIRVRLATASLDQSGPARIVSSSSNVRSRNVTLGQDGSGLEVRIRHALSDPNGMTTALRVPRCLEAGRSTDIVVVYSRGRLALYVDGRLRGSSQARPAIGALRLVSEAAWAPRVAAGLASIAWGLATALAWIGLRGARVGFPRAAVAAGTLAAAIVGLAVAAASISG